jgi:hypothetical protein
VVVLPGADKRNLGPVFVPRLTGDALKLGDARRQPTVVDTRRLPFGIVAAVSSDNEIAAEVRRLVDKVDAGDAVPEIEVEDAGRDLNVGEELPLPVIGAGSGEPLGVRPEAEADVAELTSEVRPVDPVLLVLDDFVAERSETLGDVVLSGVRDVRTEVPHIGQFHDLPLHEFELNFGVVQLPAVVGPVGGAFHLVGNAVPDDAV